MKLNAVVMTVTVLSVLSLSSRIISNTILGDSKVLMTVSLTRTILFGSGRNMAGKTKIHKTVKTAHIIINTKNQKKNTPAPNGSDSFCKARQFCF